MSIQARVFEAVRWTTATQFAAYLLTWSVNLFVVRLLRPADYGLMALAAAWIGFVDLMSGFGQRVTLVQRPTLDDATVRKIFGALVLWNLALFAVSQLAAPWIATFYGDPTLEPMVRLMSVGVLLATAAIPATALRWREIDFQAVSLVGFFQAVTTSLTVLVLALRGLGVWALVWGQVAGMLVHTFGNLWATGFRLRPDFRVRGIGPEVRFGGLVLTRAVLAYFDRQVDTLLIGKLLGSVPLGAYSVAGTVAKQPSRALLMPLQRVASPTFARLQGDLVRVREYYLGSVEAIVFVFVPMIWGIGAVADDLVTVVMGARWAPAIPILQVLCILLPLRAPLRIMGATLDGLGRPDVSLRQSVTTALCIPVGVAAGASFGILGATWGWTGAVAVALAINLRRGLAVVDVRFSAVARAVAPTLAVGAAMVAAVLYAKASVLAGVDPWLRLPASVALGAAVYGAGTWLVNRELLRRYRRVLRDRGRDDDDDDDAANGSDGTPASSA
ncbi:MAG TPA: lipopolysaccharide biosynthesis protein [Myxococcota bacterium]|nr:lipopolysaccharide biosynthesis protein [Myxococcota bacterium]